MTPFSDLIDRVADTDMNIARLERVQRNARSLVEAQSMLKEVVWLLQQQRIELKRKLDERIEEMKALKDKAKAESKSDKPAKTKAKK